MKNLETPGKTGRVGRSVDDFTDIMFGPKAVLKFVGV